MKSSEDLFRLVKSLTMSEKRYFKLFASKHKGEKNYIRLFEVIEKQDKYDEPAIREVFTGEKFVQHLTFTKNYLYHLILKSLNGYNGNISVDAQLKELLRHVAILYEKNLYTQCSKLLDRAKKIAYKYEKHLSILEILQWEQQMQRVEVNIEKIDKILAEEKKILEIYKNGSEYKGLNTILHSLIKKEGLARSQNYLKKIEKIIDHPLLNNEAQALSMQAKGCYYNIYGHYFFFKGRSYKSL